MKRIFLILCILCFPIFSFGQWVDGDGSTRTATSTSVQKEIKDIQNDVHDDGISSIRVTVSTMPQVDVTGSTVTVENFPADYPDATSQSFLSSIDTNLEHCDTKNVVITSGTTKEFQVSNATGTVLSVGTGAVTTWTFPAGAVEIILEADKTNTDITRWRYWNEQVKTAGNKLNPGDVWILDKYSGTTLYFQTEAGTQKIITQVLYE